MSKDEKYDYLALSRDDKKEPLIGEDTLKRHDSSNILNDIKTLSNEETPYIPDKEEEDKDFKQQQSSSSDDDSSHAEKNATVYKKQQDEAISYNNDYSKIKQKIDEYKVKRKNGIEGKFGKNCKRNV